MFKKIFGLLFFILVLVASTNRAEAAFYPAFLYEPNSIPVLMYHRIRSPGTITGSGDVDLEVFDRQMKYLVNKGFKTLSLSELNARLNTCPPQIKPADSREVVLTFDDGYSDFYDEVYKNYLLKYNLKATVFVIVNAVGDDPNLYYSVYRHVSWEQLNEMKQSGLVEIQSHTLSHANLGTLASQGKYDVVEKELKDSKNSLTQQLGQSVDFFCYPQGGRNNQVVSIVRNYYSLATTVTTGNATCTDRNRRLEIVRQRAPEESFIDPYVSNDYRPYVPEPNVKAGKIKLAAAAILNKPEHASIALNEKANFFNWMEQSEYFWKSDQQRYTLLHEIERNSSYRFSDNTPWSWVLGDAENIVNPNFGLFANQTAAEKISYEASRQTFEQIASPQAVSEIKEKLMALMPKVEKTHAAGNISAAIKTQTREAKIKNLGQISLNTSEVFRYCTLSIEQQEQIANILGPVITSLNLSVNLEKIRVGNSLNSFIDDGTGQAQPYIITPEKEIIFNENLFLVNSSTQMSAVIREGLEIWKDL